MNKVFSVLFLLFAFWLSSCQNPTQNNQVLNPDISADNSTIIVNDPLTKHLDLKTSDSCEVKRFALEIIDGKYLDLTKQNVDGIEIWLVRILTKDNIKVNIKIDVKYSIVINIDADSKPVNIDPKLLEKFIKLKEAVEIALKQVQGDIVHWEIRYIRKTSWVYEIKIKAKNRMVKIQIKAKGGNIVNIMDDDEKEGDKD